MRAWLGGGGAEVPDWKGPIAEMRDSVVAVLRIHRASAPPGGDPAPPPPPAALSFEVGVVGTAWCVVEDRYLITAYHVLNKGQPRDTTDHFYVFAVPQNGPLGYHTRVTGFPLEDPAADMAVLEIARPVAPFPTLPALPLTFENQADGERVCTYGFPAPIISRANLDLGGHSLGGDLFLKGHANEGIVSGQFEMDGRLTYELNVGWYNGESGGPICRPVPLAGFALMQQYRNIQTAHGVVPGPHQGRALTAIEPALRALGVTIAV